MFRRRKAEVPEDLDDTAAEAEDLTEDDEHVDDARANGPWDASEVTLDDDDENRVDLGSLLLRAREGIDVQLQVDEASGEVAAVILAGAEGAIELRAFAAPRNGDIWDDVRRGLAAEVAQMGGTATETDGPYGPAVDVSVMVQLPDGSPAQQQSKVLGIAGPRWLLRATLFGRPAFEYDEQGDLEQALREVVVVRGSGPVPPGDALPLVLPPSARRADV
jgi:Protein of unknown function (DUF3710)